jgi:dipeptidase E
MRLYLSSFRNGNKPDELLALLGNGRRTAVINNSLDMNSVADLADALKTELDRLESIGLNCEEIDLREYFGKEDDLRERLQHFDLLWVRGGNAFVLRRAFAQSGLDKILVDMLNEDKIVFGGYSAGIDMLCPTLKGVELVDDPNVVPEGYQAEIIWDGLDVLPYSVRSHYKSDHPESGASDKSIEYMIENHIPFICLRDGEAIVVNENEQHIAG